MMGEGFFWYLTTIEMVPDHLHSKEKTSQVLVNREIIPDANHRTWDSFA